MSIRDRLKRFVDYLEITDQEFEKQCKISEGTVSRISSKSYRSTFGKIAKTYPQLNLDWLLNGEGNMLNENYVSEESDIEGTISRARLIPFYDIEMTGGCEGDVSTSDEGELVGYIQPGGWIDENETAAIRHVGDSMVEYPNGCILAVRKVYDRHLLVYVRNYVIETREYRITKRVQKGDNPDSRMLYTTNTERYGDGKIDT